MGMRLSADAAATGLIIGVAALVVYSISRDTGSPDPPAPTHLGAPGGPTSSRPDLVRAIESMEARLRTHRLDRDAAILLGDASMRQARVTGNGMLNLRAAEALEPIVAARPADYEARRMLATVYAAAHRFKDAIREAERARDQKPYDPWNYGIIGDSHLERGEYPEAFEAFQKMLTTRPGAAAYARASYAFELQGRLEDAVRAMQLAADAASPRDPESVAWFHAHLAELYMDLGRLSEARMAYAWAERAFPGHPFVRTGIARLKAAEGDTAGAIAMYREELDKVGTPDVAAALGDLYERTGNTAEAERMYARAEERWRAGGLTEQDHLARFLADHERNIPEAVRLAEAGRGEDIVAQDALACAYFKAGRLREADQAASRALRTGTRNLEMLYHAAAIRHARGDDDGARAILDRAPRGTRRFPRAAAAAEELRARLRPGAPSGQ